MDPLMAEMVPGQPEPLPQPLLDPMQAAAEEQQRDMAVQQMMAQQQAAAQAPPADPAAMGGTQAMMQQAPAAPAAGQAMPAANSDPMSLAGSDGSKMAALLTLEDLDAVRGPEGEYCPDCDARQEWGGERCNRCGSENPPPGEKKADEDVVGRICQVAAEQPPSADSYGNVWWNAGEKTIWLVSADSDENEQIQAWRKAFGAIPGVHEVDCEAEASPHLPGYVRVARIGKGRVEEKRAATDIMAEDRDTCPPCPACRSKNANHVRARQYNVQCSDCGHYYVDEAYGRKTAAAGLFAARVESAAQTVIDPDTLTEAQREALNYRQGHARVHGLTITIQAAKGQRRKPTWPPLAAHYGHITGEPAKSRDGEHVDVFVGDDPDAELAFVADLVQKETGAYDEPKVVLGFPSRASAKQLIDDTYGKLGIVSGLYALTIPQLKEWLREGSAKKPIADQIASFKSAGDGSEDHLPDGLLVLDLGHSWRYVGPEA